YGEKARATSRPSGRNYQGRYSAVGRVVCDGRGQGSGRIPPDAARHSGGAQATVCRDVPEGGAAVWRLAGRMDAIAGQLRLEKVRTKQEGHGSRRADRAGQGGRRNSRLHFLGETSWTRPTNSGSSFVLRSGASGRFGRWSLRSGRTSSASIPTVGWKARFLICAFPIPAICISR